MITELKPSYATEPQNNTEEYVWDVFKCHSIPFYHKKARFYVLTDEVKEYLSSLSVEVHREDNCLVVYNNPIPANTYDYLDNFEKYFWAVMQWIRIKKYHNKNGTFFCPNRDNGVSEILKKLGYTINYQMGGMEIKW